MNDFIQFASSHGLIVNHLPIGRIVRCPTTTHRSSKNGAFYFDGLWGWIQDWATSDKIQVWKSDKVVDNAEFQQKIKESQAKYVQDKARLNAEAAKKAQWILGQCELNLSAYLGRKGFPDMSANMWMKEKDRPLLVIPMRIENKLIGCQLIDHEGSKKFLKGQATQDACFQIGNGKQVFFVEGYASGLSLQVILQSIKISYTIYVTFSAGNLLRFAKRIDGIVIADNDESKKGEEVTIESGRRYWISSVIGYDINDHQMNIGTFKTAQEIRKVIYSKP